MSDNLRRALFGNSRRKPTAAEVVIGAVLDHQANKQNRRQALPADPTLPVELQGIIKRSDYQIRNRGHHTECWIWDKSSFVLKDPTSHRHRDVNEVVYRAFAGRDVPSSSAILTRCGQAKCIKYEHFTIIPRREGNIIYRIRNRREAKINKPQRNIIAKASKKYNLTEKEQVQIFHVSESQLRETNEDALKPTITGRPTESAAPVLTTVEIETTPEGTATIPELEMPYAEPEIIELDIPPEPDKPLSPEPETRPEPQTPHLRCEQASVLLILGDSAITQPTVRRFIMKDTPLHLAVQDEDTETVKALLAAGADPNVKGEYGRTPLHEAAWIGHSETIRLLLAAGSDPNAKDHKGLTPLHTAASGNSEIVQILLPAGAGTPTH